MKEKLAPGRLKDVIQTKFLSFDHKTFTEIRGILESEGIVIENDRQLKSKLEMYIGFSYMTYDGEILVKTCSEEDWKTVYGYEKNAGRRSHKSTSEFVSQPTRDRRVLQGEADTYPHHVTTRSSTKGGFRD